MSIRLSASLIPLCAFAGLSVACAAAPPPDSLVTARAAYATTSAGGARELAPVELDNARLALVEAENSFADHGNVPVTTDLSYIAQRRSLQAGAYANIAAAQRQSGAAQAEQIRVQAANHRETVAELGATRQTVTAQRQQIAVEHQQIAAGQQQIAAGQQALDQEHRARTEAERTAAAALESLRLVASVREETRGMVITLSGSVLFATGQSMLLPIAQQRLLQVSATLHDHLSQNMVVEGHTDSRGSAASNDALSLARAQSVLAFLVSNGVPSNRIRAQGIGSSRPVSDNTTADGRANNRRVEIVIAPATAAVSTL